MQRLIVLLIALVWTWGAPAQEHPVLYQQKLPPPTAPIFVTVQFEGRDVLMMLDTGAPLTVFDPSMQSELGTRLSDEEVERRQLPSGGDGYYPSKEFRLGDLTVTPPVILTRDLSSFRTATGLEIRGVLGSNSLKEWVLEADYERNLLLFTKALPAAAARMKSVPIEMRFGRPYIVVRIGDQDVPVMIDAGFTGALKLKETVFTPLVESGNVTVLERVKFFTAKGMVEMTEGEFHFGHVLDVPLQGLRVSSNVEYNLLGQDLLTRMHWILDLSGGRFYYEPLKKQPPPWKDRAGAAGFYKDGCLVVMEVKPGLLFDKAGIKAGDCITAMGPLKKGEINLLSMKELVATSPGQTITLEVVRKGQDAPLRIPYTLPEK